MEEEESALILHFVNRNGFSARKQTHTLRRKELSQEVRHLDFIERREGLDKAKEAREEAVGTQEREATPRVVLVDENVPGFV